MKLVYYNDFTLGVVKGERVVDVSGVVAGVPRVGPGDLIARVIEGFGELRPRLEQVVASSEGVPLDAVRLRPPLPKPGKILCMAGNYLENGTLQEARPINGFLKSTNAVTLVRIKPKRRTISADTMKKRRTISAVTMPKSRGFGTKAPWTSPPTITTAATDIRIIRPWRRNTEPAKAPVPRSLSNIVKILLAQL